MPAYAVERLAKSFPGAGGKPLKALDGASFAVNPGEILVVLGPNGAGKTTLLRLLAGLFDPDDGEIRADGESLLRVPPHKRDIAMVFQDFSLYPRFSVAKNLAMPLRSRGARLDEYEITSRVNETADLLGLLDKLDRKPAQLSGGEMQRVAIGRALVRRPKLFLLDEPFTHLDTQLRARMRVEIRQIQRRLGVAMIHVTHHHEEAMGLADRILVLEGGRVLQIGAPEEVYHRPRNSHVARMLGNPPINLIPAEKAAALGLSVGRGKIAGIRPESFRVTPGGEEGATVKAVENLGPTSILLLEAGGLLLRAVVPPTTRSRLGEKMRLSVDPEDLHWFQE